MPSAVATLKAEHESLRSENERLRARKLATVSRQIAMPVFSPEIIGPSGSLGLAALRSGGRE